MDNKQARYLHQMLDRLAEGKNLSPEEITLLRKNLPELPKQKTLEEIAWDMDSAWAETSGNDWKAELFGDLEPWLAEQHAQLRAHLEGVKSQAHPTLPDGMRIAEHENFGRVVVSPKVNVAGRYEVFYLAPSAASGTDLDEVEPDSLTFVDAEPAKPAHPEFLETEADYAAAPEGTIAASGDDLPWTKDDSSWLSVEYIGAKDDRGMSPTRRQNLRWGWGK